MITFGCNTNTCNTFGLDVQEIPQSISTKRQNKQAQSVILQIVRATLQSTLQQKIVLHHCRQFGSARNVHATEQLRAHDCNVKRSH